jgi:hypothetical protein
MREIDNLIIGGGLFGIYAALLAPAGETTLILEKEDKLMLRASTINQARLHTGLHYLRSIRTAQSANFHFERFLKEHSKFINEGFDHLYLIAQRNSLSNTKDLMRVAKNLGVRVEELSDHPSINKENTEGIFRVNEPSIDLEMLRDHYVSRVNGLKESPILNVTKLEMEQYKNSIIATVTTRNEEIQYKIKKRLIVAAYSGLNEVLEKLKIPKEKITYELSEVVYAKSDELENLGITVMDGQHVSAIPFGFTGLSTITSVKYTHRSMASESSLMDCQIKHGQCKPNSLFLCGKCVHCPSSASSYMVNQLQHYFKRPLNIAVHANKFEVKAFWNSLPSFDHRLTSIKSYDLVDCNVSIFGVLSGKLSNIYELESIYD